MNIIVIIIINERIRAKSKYLNNATCCMLSGHTDACWLFLRFFIYLILWVNWIVCEMFSLNWSLTWKCLPHSGTTVTIKIISIKSIMCSVWKKVRTQRTRDRNQQQQQQIVRSHFSRWHWNSGAFVRFFILIFDHIMRYLFV